jgi:hypothetical protein
MAAMAATREICDRKLVAPSEPPGTVLAGTFCTVENRPWWFLCSFPDAFRDTFRLENWKSACKYYIIVATNGKAL